MWIACADGDLHFVPCQDCGKPGLEFDLSDEGMLNVRLCAACLNEVINGFRPDEQFFIREHLVGRVVKDPTS
jgi:hypothetical protein